MGLKGKGLMARAPLQPLSQGKALQGFFHSSAHYCQLFWAFGLQLL